MDGRKHYTYLDRFYITSKKKDFLPQLEVFVVIIAY